MQKFVTRYYPIIRKPEDMPETHIMVSLFHQTGRESCHERVTGFLCVAQSAIMDDAGMISVIYDGRQRPYCRIHIPKRNTVSNRAEFLSERNIAEMMLKIKLHCKDFGIEIDDGNFFESKI